VIQPIFAICSSIPPPPPQAFVDITETVSVELPPNGGMATKVEVSGTVTARCFVSGESRVSVGLPDRVAVMKEDGAYAGRDPEAITIEAYTLGEGVSVPEWRTNRVLCVEASEGVEAELLRYRVVRNVELPFRVVPRVTFVAARELALTVRVVGEVPGRAAISDVRVCFPVPAHTIERIIFKTSTTHIAEYRESSGRVEWKIPMFGAGTEQELTARVYLRPESSVSASSPIKRGFGPVSLTFEVHHFTATRMGASYVRLERRHADRVGDGEVKKWIRQSVRSGSYCAAF